MDSKRTALAALVSVAVLVILVGRSYIRRDDDAESASDTSQTMAAGAAVGYSNNVFGCPSAFNGNHCVFDGFLYSVDGSTSESSIPRGALLPIPEENGVEAHGSNLLLLPSGIAVLQGNTGRRAGHLVSMYNSLHIVLVLRIDCRRFVALLV